MPDDVPALPAAFLDELRARTPLPKMISRSVRLERSGRQWKGNCPFHAERTPSFNVRDDHYHCFGCGAHGDAIEFVMQSQGATFMEAVERLAKEAGLEIPKTSPAAPAPIGAVTGMQGKPAPGTTAPSRAPAHVAEVLKRMERMHDAIGGSDPLLADVMSYLIQRGVDRDRRAQPRFQHNVAYVLQDL